MVNYDLTEIRDRIRELREENLGKSKLISRIVHECSVDPSLVSSSMPHQAIARVIFHNQGSARGLKEEMEAETLYLDNLRK